MVIYVLLLNTDYEGSELLGVYSSVEKAKKALNKDVTWVNYITDESEYAYWEDGTYEIDAREIDA